MEVTPEMIKDIYINSLPADLKTIWLMVCGKLGDGKRYTVREIANKYNVSWTVIEKKLMDIIDNSSLDLISKYIEIDSPTYHATKEMFKDRILTIEDVFDPYDTTFQKAFELLHRDAKENYGFLTARWTCTRPTHGQKVSFYQLQHEFYDRKVYVHPLFFQLTWLYNKAKISGDENKEEIIARIYFYFLGPTGRQAYLIMYPERFGLPKDYFWNRCKVHETDRDWWDVLVSLRPDLEHKGTMSSRIGQEFYEAMRYSIEDDRLLNNKQLFRLAAKYTFLEQQIPADIQEGLYTLLGFEAPPKENIEKGLTITRRQQLDRGFDIQKTLTLS